MKEVSGSGPLRPASSMRKGTILKTTKYWLSYRLRKNLTVIENYGGPGEVMPLRTICDVGNSRKREGKSPLVEADAWREFCGAKYPVDSPVGSLEPARQVPPSPAVSRGDGGGLPRPLGIMFQDGRVD